VPVFRSGRAEEVAAGALEHVDEVLLVDDGAPPELAARLRELAWRDERISCLHREGNGGKGAALADAFALVLERARPPDAVLTLDADGQHPPEVIPAFLAASPAADVVIGDRRDRRGGGMPWIRRVANRASSAALGIAIRRRVPDAQNGMRLLRTHTLARVPFERGRFEAETRHLKALARAGADVVWTPMPTVYAGEHSSYRPLVDSARIAREIVRRPRLAPLPAPGVLRDVARQWAPRLALGVLGVIAVGLTLPVLQPLDESLFGRINALGDGPEWVYATLDPHSRNYVLLTLLAVLAAALAHVRLRYTVGATLAMLFAAFGSDAILEIFQVLFDRPRPEEAIGAAVQLTHERSWAHIPSFPSGHLMVTTAMVVTAIGLVPRLRWVLLPYLAAIAITRVTFGAHFPLDVVVGIAIGRECGLFTLAAFRAAALVPAAKAAEPVAAPVAEPVGVVASTRR
jgi:membrane-associated phospholipid phosphatase